ncbi:MAG: hypothetical protein IBX50_08225 [Marinospirillum sp.]|uniref:hypothetical protein n=1 Tax=Marinospirillum sp. TaxID=2183934 RepID=UPI0019F79EC9|nr:hypothetical protein [Marinospirillum sp.]MBE0506692.1 hypothetical protein [Marinospirillum sp.]
MLIRDTDCCFRHQIEQAVGKDATGKETLDHIFGTYDNDYRGNTDIVLRVWRNDKRTAWQRLNMFWAMPLTLILSPIQYVMVGQVGWDTKTKFGRFVLRVTGHLKE